MYAAFVGYYFNLATPITFKVRILGIILGAGEYGEKSVSTAELSTAPQAPVPHTVHGGPTSYYIVCNPAGYSH